MTSDPPDLNPLLAQLFRAHGIDAVTDGEWVVLPGHDLRIRGEVFERADLETRPLQIDVRVRIGPGRMLVESFAGVGGTREEAVKDALENFARSSFHVLLAAFVRPEDDQVSQEEWIIGGRRRSVTVGNFVIRGSLPDGADLPACFAWLNEKIEAAEFPDGIHWVRLYYSQGDGEEFAREILRDNEPWEELQAEMTAAPWPRGDGFCSVRLFLVFQGGLEVSRAADAIVRHTHLDDESLIAALIEEGFSPAAAERAVVFIPAAFGHVLLERMGTGYSETVTLRSLHTDEVRESRFDAEPVYVEARRLAKEGAFQYGWMTREEFEAIAWRDGAVKAVNAHLYEGADLKDLVPVPSFAYLDRLDLLDPAEDPMPHRPTIARETASRPWWRFWR